MKCDLQNPWDFLFLNQKPQNKWAKTPVKNLDFCLILSWKSLQNKVIQF